MSEAKEPLKLYLDDDKEPFKVAYPPLRFHFNTIALPDGPHKLRVEASNGLAPPTIREIPFHVRNGVAISIYGLEQQQTIGGQVELIINAYAGNTEVDFEPRRAETPQPIPTWAWVVFLAVTAWAMFYVLNPTIVPRDATASSSAVVANPTKGHQLFVDTCARCHGEDGDGRREGPGDAGFVVPPLRDNVVALEETPLRLLDRVVTGVPENSMMPAWGPRLSNEEILSVVNHVRTAWDHNASRLEPRFRSPPAAISEVETRFVEALRRKDRTALAACCWPEGVQPPHLFRTDGVDERGTKDVQRAWHDYLDALQAGRVENLQLLDARYDYESPDPQVVFGWGRIFLDTKTAEGKEDRAKGRFIRVYQKSRKTGEWAIVFDFADIRMHVGCLPEHLPAPDCPPLEPPTDVLPGVPDVVPVSPANGGTSDIGYAEVQALIRGLNKGAKSSPHENFWELPYEKFVSFEFEDYADGAKIRLLVPYDGKNSNLVKALRDGKGITITKADGTPGTKNVTRMPKNAAPMSDEDVAEIERWIDAGAPEHAGKPSALARGAGAGGGGPPEDGTKPDEPAVVSDLGYADVQNLVQKLNKGAKSSPHENFWELPYEKFVAFEFEDYADGAKIRLLVPYDGKNSNLVKALRDGKGITITKADGTPGTKNVTRMPKNAAPMPDEDVAKIERWIDAGAPEHAGKPSALPRPGKDGAKPSPPEPAAPDGSPAPSGGFPAPSGGGFPAPAPEPPPAGGFPPPQDPPPSGGGFPPPSGG
jgi:mono/diheme cytochrome c family protein/ketosteroid isomerase-like protein